MRSPACSGSLHHAPDWCSDSCVDVGSSTFCSVPGHTKTGWAGRADREEAGGREGERASWSHVRGGPGCPLLLLQSWLLGRAGDGKGFPGWDPCPPSCPSPWSCQPWRPSRAGLVWVRGWGCVPPSPPWQLETPPAGDEGVSKSPPGVFGFFFWGGKGSPAAGAPPLPYGRTRVQDPILHQDTLKKKKKVTFFLLQKLQGRAEMGSQGASPLWRLLMQPIPTLPGPTPSLAKAGSGSSSQARLDRLGRPASPAGGSLRGLGSAVH
jgi:hypothetical protein